MGKAILRSQHYEGDVLAKSMRQASVKHSMPKLTGRKITLIDTPDLFDTENKPGRHEDGQMIRLDMKLTEQEVNVVKWIQENFGDPLLLLTHGDLPEEEPMGDFMHKIPALASLSEQFGGTVDKRL